MRILFLSRWYPYPSDNGSKIRVFGLLRGLCERHEVTLISFVNPSEKNSGQPVPAPGPVETRTCPYAEFKPKSYRAMLGFLSGTPRSLIDTYSREMANLIQQAVAKESFDLVIASQLAMAAYYPIFKGIPAIFEEAELGAYWPYSTEKQPSWSLFRKKLTWKKHRRFMSSALKAFRACTVASDVERQLLAEAAPSFQSVHVIPNSVDTEPVEVRDEQRLPGSLIFSGSLRYAPNHDAMSWFISQILPMIHAESPNVRLTITGDSGSHELPPAPNVVMTGHVENVRSIVSTSSISVAPIRAGGGTRLKILEAMAVGTPVVATTKAVEGLDVRHGEHLLIANTPGEFAQAVFRLQRNPTAAREIAARAQNLVQSRYSSSVVVPLFVQLAERAVMPGGSRAQIERNL